MVRISPEDVGKRIILKDKTTAIKKVEGTLETITKRLIVIDTNRHAKLFIPFTILERKYTYQIH